VFPAGVRGTRLPQDRHEYIGRYLDPRTGVSRAYSAHWKLLRWLMDRKRRSG